MSDWKAYKAKTDAEPLHYDCRALKCGDICDRFPYKYSWIQMLYIYGVEKLLMREIEAMIDSYIKPSPKKVEAVIDAIGVGTLGLLGYGTAQAVHATGVTAGLPGIFTKPVKTRILEAIRRSIRESI